MLVIRPESDCGRRTVQEVLEQDRLDSRAEEQPAHGSFDTPEARETHLDDYVDQPRGNANAPEDPIALQAGQCSHHEPIDRHEEAHAAADPEEGRHRWGAERFAREY